MYTEKLACKTIARDELRPTKGVSITTLPKITKEFAIRFEVNASSFSNAWHNLLHMTKGGNVESHGDRIPWVGIRDSSLTIAYSVNGDLNYHKGVEINKNEWVSFEVSQTHERTGEYRYNVLMNGVEQEAFGAINDKPLDFEHVGVYASDPWHTSFDGLIRDIEVCVAGKHASI